MGWQQRNGCYRNTNQSTTGAAGHYQITLNAVLPDFGGPLTSAAVQVRGSGPVRFFARATSNGTLDTCRVKIRRPGGADLVAGPQAKVSDATLDVHDVEDGELFQLWIQSFGNFQPFTGGTTNTYLYYEPIGVRPISNGVPMGRAAFL